MQALLEILKKIKNSLLQLIGSNQNETPKE